ncbi:MAG: transglycosylase domain-containing protein [Alistipes indistinctus]
MAQKLIDKLQTPKAIKWFWILLASPVALILLLLLLIGIGVFGKLPTFEELENPKSNLATEIYSEDGKMIGSFFVQNRSYCDYDELSPSLVAALVSTEDMRFYSHSGIDFISLARVAVRTIALAQFGGRAAAVRSRSSWPKTSTRAIRRSYNNPISKGSEVGDFEAQRVDYSRHARAELYERGDHQRCTSIRWSTAATRTASSPLRGLSSTSCPRN